MARGKKYSPEEIIPKLRESEVLMSQGAIFGGDAPTSSEEARTTAAIRTRVAICINVVLKIQCLMIEHSGYCSTALPNSSIKS